MGYRLDPPPELTPERMFKRRSNAMAMAKEIQKMRSSSTAFHMQSPKGIHQRLGPRSARPSMRRRECNERLTQNEIDCFDIQAAFL
jgi:hypothetical protein